MNNSSIVKQQTLIVMTTSLSSLAIPVTATVHYAVRTGGLWTVHYTL